MQVQKVVKAEISGPNLECLSQWKLKLACGNTVYRTRQKRKGKKIWPAPVRVNCLCKKCYSLIHKPLSYSPSYYPYEYEEEF